jgi:NIMA (never in mitosis gene a)-related kinase
LYDFTGTSEARLGGSKVSFSRLMLMLSKNRISNEQWGATSTNVQKLQTLQCVRLMMRDGNLRAHLRDEGGVAGGRSCIDSLAHMFMSYANSYYTTGRDAPFIADVLTELANIMKRLAEEPQSRLILLDHNVHNTFVLLLGSKDSYILQCVLAALINFVNDDTEAGSHRNELDESYHVREKCLESLSRLECVETLLRFVQEYSVHFKCLAVELLTCLAELEKCRRQMKSFHALSMCLSVLHLTADLELVQQLLRLLSQLLGDDTHSIEELRLLGGVPLLLSFLSERWEWGISSSALTNPEACNMSATEAHAVTSQHAITVFSICSCLTQLAMEDESNYQIRVSNGVVTVAQLLLSDIWKPFAHEKNHLNVWAGAARTLRLIFSCERNRKIFRRLLPTELYGPFIDVGHYNRKLESYLPLCEVRFRLSQPSHASVLQKFQQSIHEIDIVRLQTEAPSIRGYKVQELLGKGGFGAVYQVVDENEVQHAMKELPLEDADASFSSSKDGEVDPGILEEAKVMQSLHHPNVCKLVEYFVEKRHLYIVMELVKGMSLGEYFSTISEKGLRLKEEKIWSIFIPLVQGVHYLHVKKNVVHRDINPNNIMIDTFLRVKITDFGLARQQRGDQTKDKHLQNVVGTVLYTCPEILQNRPYTAKADVWSLGCILYQMVALTPPFHGNNPLQIAQQIVEGHYQPILERIQMERTAPSSPTSDPDKTAAKQDLGMEDQSHHNNKPSELWNDKITQSMADPSPLLCDIIAKMLSTEPVDRPSIGDVVQMIAPKIIEEMEKVNYEVDVTKAKLAREIEAKEQQSAEVYRSRAAYQRILAAKSASSSRRPKSNIEIPAEAATTTTTVHFAPTPPLNEGGETGAAEPGSRALTQPQADPHPVVHAGDDDEQDQHQRGVAPMLTVSGLQVRPIEDQCEILLKQAHKLILIEQLPPPVIRTAASSRRNVVDRYKREIFSPMRASSLNLKTELKKLVEGWFVFPLVCLDTRL